MNIFCFNNSLFEDESANNIARKGMIKGFSNLDQLDSIEAYFITNKTKNFETENKNEVSLNLLYLPSNTDILSKEDDITKIKRMLFYNRIIDLHFLWILLNQPSSRDITYIRGFKGSISVYIASLLLNRRYIFEMHNYEFGSNRLKDLICRKLLNASILNVTVSEYTAENWKINGVKNKILVEPSGVDLDKFKTTNSKIESRSELGLSLDDFLAVYTGKIHENKGINILIEASKHLDNKNIKIIIIGGSEETIKEYKSKKQEENLDNIVFEGYKKHNKIQEYQNAADVLLLPNSRSNMHSREYTSPIKLSEYIISNKPIICSKLPSITRRISEDECFFFEPDEPKELAKILSKIHKNPELASKKNIEKRRSRELSWTKRCERIFENFN